MIVFTSYAFQVNCYFPLWIINVQLSRVGATEIFHLLWLIYPATILDGELQSNNIWKSTVWRRIFYGMSAKKICNPVFLIFNRNYKYRPSFISRLCTRLCTLRNVNPLKKCYLPYKYFLSFQLGTNKLEWFPFLGLSLFSLLYTLMFVLIP